MANRLRTPIDSRFWPNVIPEPNSGCWLWLGYSSKGYGRISLGGRGGKMVNATRVSLRLAGRNVADDAFILHECDTPACVNPDHLTPGTQAKNLAGMRARRRHSHGEIHSAALRAREVKTRPMPGDLHPRWGHRTTHCPRGHEKTGENALISPQGHVRCRACRNEAARLREREKYQAKRAKNGAITIKELS